MGRALKGSVDVVRAILRWKWSRSGLRTTPYAEAGGFLTVTPCAPAPDVQLHFVIAPLEDHGRVAVKAHGFSCHVCVLRPESAGQVTLASADPRAAPLIDRSEEHTSELQSLMRISYAVFCLKKKNHKKSILLVINTNTAQ